MEEVQCEFRLGDKEVPTVCGERRGCSSEYRQKVILEGADGSLCCIASMDIGRDELEFALVVGYRTLEG